MEPHALLPSVREYTAVVALQTSVNWAHIALARTEPRQKREADDAVAVPEVSVSHAGEDDGEADGQIEAAALRAQAGVAALGANTRIVHHFQEDQLRKVLDFTTADRTPGFVKELLKTSVMQGGELPQPRNRQDGADRRTTHVAEHIQEGFETLAHLSSETLKALVEAQRLSWKTAAATADRTRSLPRPPPEETAVVLRTRKHTRTSPHLAAAPCRRRTSPPATRGAARATTWRT